MSTPRGQADDPLLSELAQALDAGDLPDLEELRQRYPERGSSADRLVAAALGYRRSVRAGERPAPLLEPGARLGDF